MKKLLVVFIVLFVGCAGVNQFPQCNEKYDQTAVLAQIANANGLCLRDVGNALILANGIAIQYSQLYTAEQAFTAVNEWIDALGQPISALAFKELVKADIATFPELMIVLDGFDIGFSSTNLIDAASVEILRSYLKDRVLPLLAARLR